MIKGSTMKLSGFVAVAALVAAGIFLNGCESDKPVQTPRISAEDVFKEMQEDFKRMKDPKSSVKMMRNYAMEKLPNATDEELRFLMNEPQVKPNYDGSMYAFFWERPYGEGIQVLATPPPCRPIEVFRTRRARFP
jgi:hypothetical protein